MLLSVQAKHASNCRTVFYHMNELEQKTYHGFRRNGISEFSISIGSRIRYSFLRSDLGLKPLAWYLFDAKFVSHTSTRGLARRHPGQPPLSLLQRCRYV